MKRSYKCFGLLLALFTMVGLSLSVSSGDTNALLHDITAIPLYSDSIPYWSRNGKPLENDKLHMTWSSSNSQINDLDIKAPWVFYSTRNGSQDGKCRFNNSYDKAWSYYGSTGVDIGFLSTRGLSSGTFSSYPDRSDLAICRQIAQFGTVTSPAYGALSVYPEIVPSSFDGNVYLDRPNPRSLLPYYYEYSHAFITRDHQSEDNEGYHYTTSLKMSDLYGVIPNKFSTLYIPLGRADPNTIGNLTSGRSIEYRGIFSFPGVSNGNGFSYSPAFGGNNSEFKLYFTGASTLSTSDSITTYTQEVNCNLRTVQVMNDLTIQYSCPLVLDRNYEIGYANLHIESFDNNNSANSYVFDTTADWMWSGFRVVTDYDETPGANYNDTPTGNNIQEAPNGSTSVPSDQEWFDNLSGLFNFSFINPFEPLFGLFTNSSCVNIPTLAGMIHSNETQVCPWFDSNTRSIVTPVLGISSMMLVFGFAVRWLGARSGNLFEDSFEGEGFVRSKGVTTDNYHFSNKYRSRK